MSLLSAFLSALINCTLTPTANSRHATECTTHMCCGDKCAGCQSQSDCNARHAHNINSQTLHTRKTIQTHTHTPNDTYFVPTISQDRTNSGASALLVFARANIRCNLPTYTSTHASERARRRIASASSRALACSHPSRCHRARSNAASSQCARTHIMLANRVRDINNQRIDVYLRSHLQCDANAMYRDVSARARARAA